MTRQPLRRELSLLEKRADIDGLRSLLQEGPEPLALLGLQPEQLTAFLEAPPHLLLLAVRNRLDALKDEETKTTQAASRRVASSAATQLAKRAFWTRESAYLDVSILFGALLADRRSPYVVFSLDETTVAIPRGLLAKARASLKPFKDVRGYVDTKGLHLRWREGRGGLDLISRTLNADERAASVFVVLSRPSYFTIRPLVSGSAAVTISVAI